MLVVLVMLASFVGVSVKSFLGLAFSLCFNYSQSDIAFLGISFSINFNSIDGFATRRLQRSKDV